jgi:anti-anti-sigma regulatory factor
MATEGAPERDAAPDGAAAAGDGAAPKLVIEKYADGAISCLRLSGTIDEDFEGKRLGATAAGEVLVLDLGGVKKISSFGIREWVDFVGAAGKQVRALILIECAPKVVDQLNMVANFTGGGRVYSFYAPFRCDYCDSEHRALLQIDRDHEAIKAMKLADRPCPSCGEGMYFDEDGATYLSYVVGQEPFELPPGVAGFLAARLDYAVSALSRKLRVDKLIDGRTTYLRLSGDLGADFPRDKLAEGLEGTVIVDLGGLGRIEPAGAAEWRAFVQAAAPLVEQLYLAHVPPAFLEKLCSREDLGPRAQVVTFTLPYRCEACGATSGPLIDLAAHHAVTKFATAPELRCPRCRQAMQCAAGEAAMAALPGLGKPTAPPELVRSIPILRERAQQPAPRRLGARPGAAPGAPPAALSRAGLLGPVLAALLAVAIAAGGYAAYRRLVREPDGPAAPAIAARSAPARPAWIAIELPGSAACVDAPGQGIACVGVSPPSARRDDAEAEAADAAYEAAAGAIALRIADPAWRRAVPPIYGAAREAKLGALDRAPEQTSARRDVREARAAVARALRATGGGAVPATPTGRYWEEHTGPDGKRYVAFAQVALGATELARLLEAYAQPASALGATVVGAFPLVGWRYPQVERGAIVTALGPGPLQDLGLAAQHVVLSIDGRDVTDAAAFGQIAAEELAQLEARGGTLRLKVQTPDPAPRELAATIRPRAGAGRAGDAAPGRGEAGPPLGGVNVWDRFGGGKGSGRDDPAQ